MRGPKWSLPVVNKFRNRRRGSSTASMCMWRSFSDDEDAEAGIRDVYENECIICGSDMGAQNPRQYCGKWCRLLDDVFIALPRLV